MCHFEGLPRNLSLVGVSGMKLHHHSKNSWLDESPVGRYGSAREKDCLDLHPFKEEL